MGASKIQVNSLSLILYTHIYIHMVSRGNPNYHLTWNVIGYSFTHSHYWYMVVMNIIVPRCTTLGFTSETIPREGFRVSCLKPSSSRVLLISHLIRGWVLKQLHREGFTLKLILEGFHFETTPLLGFTSELPQRGFLFKPSQESFSIIAVFKYSLMHLNDECKDYIGQSSMSVCPETP